MGTIRFGRLVRFAALAGMLALVVAAVTGATTGSLPGGTSIEATITSPSNGAVLPVGPVTVTGTASVGTAAPIANTTLVYIVDVSGSTSQVTSTAAKCPNQNVYDSTAGTTLDCELLAVRDMNQAAIAAGTVAKVGLIAFGGTAVGGFTGAVWGLATDAQALDLQPAGGAQQLVAANASTYHPSIFHLDTPATDLDWVLQSAYADNISTPSGWLSPTPYVGFTLFTPFSNNGSTNYWAAINNLKTLAASATTPNILAVMLSDGDSNVGGPHGEPVSNALSGMPANVTVDTFAVGGLASCNPGGVNMGTLQQIANATHAACTAISDPGNVANAIPDVIASTLSSISLQADGGPAQSPTVTPALPRKGPDSVTWSKTYTGLVAGPHHVCVSANGSDGGGTGSVQDCVDFTIKAVPTVTVGNGSGNAGTTDEGTAFPLTASTSSDPLLWSASGGTGHCTFSSPSSASTNVTCDDNGVYTLTLTANDGVNPPVSASETLTVNNVAPQVSAPASPPTVAPGSPVTVSWPFTDPGTNDTFTCSVNWGDSTTGVGTISGNTCVGTHTYASGGSFNAIATVTDDDGGSGSAGVEVTVDRAPTCAGVTASPDTLWPPNNKLIDVTLAGGSDPDGDTFSLTVTGITQDEPASAGGDARILSPTAVQLRAQRDGSGDGRVYRIAYTLTDSFGLSCTGVVRVGVPHDERGAAAVDSGGAYNSLP